MIKSDLSVAVVILAAGNSSRMHATKQLLPWGDSTLLGTAIQAAQASLCHEVFVVLGAEAETIQANNKNETVNWIINQDWAQGMGTSIATAVNFIVAEHTNYNAILFILADQPLVSADYLNRIIQTFESSEKSIVATSYVGNMGVPVIYDKIYFNQLAKLDGATGAKKIIMGNLDDVVGILPNGIEMDLDTMDEYEQAKKQFN